MTVSCLLAPARQPGVPLCEVWLCVFGTSADSLRVALRDKLGPDGAEYLAGILEATSINTCECATFRCNCAAVAFGLPGSWEATMLS